MWCVLGEEEKYLQVGITKGKEPLAKPRRRYKTINNLKSTVWEGKDWIHRGQDKDNWKNSCENGHEPLGSM